MGRRRSRRQPPERAEFVEKLAPTVPAQSRGVWRKAMDGSPSLANAIKAKCLECSNFFKPEITHCQVHECPLWLYRPYQDD